MTYKTIIVRELTVEEDDPKIVSDLSGSPDGTVLGSCDGILLGKTDGNPVGIKKSLTVGTIAGLLIE